jgi:hypothetical protein
VCRPFVTSPTGYSREGAGEARIEAEHAGLTYPASFVLGGRAGAGGGSALTFGEAASNFDQGCHI